MSQSEQQKETELTYPGHYKAASHSSVQGKKPKDHKTAYMMNLDIDKDGLVAGVDESSRHVPHKPKSFDTTTSRRKSPTVAFSDKTYDLTVFAIACRLSGLPPKNCKDKSERKSTKPDKILHSDHTCSSGQRNGTCFTSTECADKGGRAGGNCAAGFGVCCVFIENSVGGGDVNNNCSYLQNPDFPSATASPSTYAYNINKISDDICYIRLDFEVFTLAGTGVSDESNGCSQDSLTISNPGGQNIPIICGENAGQHMYVPIRSNSGNSLGVSLALVGTNENRLWDIKVSQIECSNPMAPPNGCLQFVTGLTGRFETFNWANSAESHLPDHDYSFCVRPEAGFCCVQYQVCSDVGDETVFSLTVNNGAGVAIDNNVDDACSSADYLSIEGSSSLCERNANLAEDSRYCGAAINNNVASNLNAPVCDCSAPFFVHVFTDALPDSGSSATANTVAANQWISRGACLEYRQVPC